MPDLVTLQDDTRSAATCKTAPSSDDLDPQCAACLPRTWLRAVLPGVAGVIPQVGTPRVRTDSLVGGTDPITR